MAQLRAIRWAFLCVMGLTLPVSAQDEHRIWGQVHTRSGDVHEGFIRWDRNEGSWVDILDGSKEIPEENYRAWLAANDAGRAIRTIDLLGFRITWDEDDPDFPLTAGSGIRFGHLASLRVIERDRVELTLRSGELLEIEGGSTDLGRSMRELVVDVPGRDAVELRWRELDRVVFSAVPSGVRASARRLYGTVEDELGNQFTGYVSWDLDEILESDVLDGEAMEGGDERDIRFGDIASIERIRGGARVVLRDGAEVDLTGTNDVDRGNRGIQISDPGLGMVEVEWRKFRMLRFHDADAVVDYDAFDGGRPLLGTVVTQSGEELDGVIRWDADEASSWEFLNGRAHEVVFTIELGYVSRIVRGEAFGATVTLVDGRTFELDGSSDVDWGNKGIMVAPQGASGIDGPDGDTRWRLIPWEEFAEVRFRAATTADSRRQGS